MALREQDLEFERYRGIYEASIDAIVVVDGEGVITGFNPAAERIFGYSVLYAAGQQMADLLIPPQHRRRHHEGLSELRRTGRSRILGQRVEVTGMRADGNEFPAELTIAQIDSDPARFCAFVRDVTNERRKEEALRGLVRDNSQILSAAGDGIYRMDLEGRITYANPAAAELLGYEIPDLIGLPAHEVLHHTRADGTPYPAEECPIRSAVATGEVTRATSEVFWRSDGSPLAVEYTSAPVRDGEKIVGAVCVFADNTEAREREAELRERVEWTDRVHVAARSDDFVLYSQPIHSLATREIEMVELLVRLRTSQGGVLNPGAFIPEAERFGLVGEIDRWVLAKAAHLSRSRRVSVNVSAASVSDLEFAIWAEETIRELGEPSNLILEITETAALANARDAEAVTQRLVRLGCELALDDFGTGYGSFAEIKRLPLAYLKIDREFVSNMVNAGEDAQVVQSIVELARTFGLKTVAEGVEDQPTLELLEAMGVDFAQGFYLGRLGPLEE
jgi:PAS domain S-box-containing protein